MYESNNMEEIQKIIDIIPYLTNYTTIYISIGSKYHNDNYYPKGFTNTGAYQLVPEFIKNEAFLNEESKVLIIIIDEFKPDELLMNTNKIKERLYDIDSNVNFIIVNHYFDDAIKNQIVNLINIITTQNIYIIDYVYFFAEEPTIKEQDNLKKMKILLTELLDLLKNKYRFSDLPHNKNIYKWLGLIDVTYISNLDFYSLVWCWLPQAKIKSKNGKHQQLDSLTKYMLKITPDFG
jgi:hypothetical protein